MKIEIDIYKSSVSKSERSNYLTIETDSTIDEHFEVEEVIKNFKASDLLDAIGFSLIKDYLLSEGYKVEELQDENK